MNEFDYRKRAITTFPKREWIRTLHQSIFTVSPLVRKWLSTLNYRNVAKSYTCPLMVSFMPAWCAYSVHHSNTYLGVAVKVLCKCGLSLSPVDFMEGRLI